MKTVILFAGRILLAVQCLVLNVYNANAQKQTPKYQTTINSNSNGFYEYLPQGYESGSQTYPLMVFLHGIGELGDGSPSSLPTVLRNGPPKMINEGSFPVSFTVNGETFKFIIISPQFINWPVADDIQAVIDYAVKNYRVNTNRIYVTGLSMGGGVVWDYGSYNATYANRVAAIVPVCGASGPTPDKVKVIVSANLAVWATHNQDDPSVPSSNTIDYVNNINSFSPAPTIPAKKTIFPVSGHDAWSTTYSVNFKENNLNIYEWMLQYQRGTGAQPVKIDPPATPLPGKIEAEDYAAMKGVQSENTTDTNGGEDVGFIDTGDWLDYKVNVTASGNFTVNLRVASTTAGQLQLLNAKGETLGYADVPQTGGFQKWTTISANIDLPAGVQTLRLNASKGGWNINWMDFVANNQASKGGVSIPGKIEAENFDGMYGIYTEPTTDDGGGKNVGWIATGDWMDYNTNVSQAGNYTVNFRLATTQRTQQLQLRNSSGAVLGTLTVPQTGNYQSWATASMVVNLPAGSQTLRVYSSLGSYNINWLEFVSGGSLSTADASKENTSAQAAAMKEMLTISSNPVQDKILLQVNNSSVGAVDVRIADQSGRIIKSLKFEKNQQVSQLNISTDGMIPGIYVMMVQIGNWSQSRKIIKM